MPRAKDSRHIDEVENGSQESRPGHHTDGPPRREEVAGYLTEMLSELASLADRAGMAVTCHLLRMAEDDARTHLRERDQETR